MAKQAQSTKFMALDASRSFDSAEDAIADGDFYSALRNIRAAEFYRGQFALRASKKDTDKALALQERSKFVADAFLDKAGI